MTLCNRGSLHRRIFPWNLIKNSLLLCFLSLSLVSCGISSNSGHPADESLLIDVKLRMLLALVNMPEMCSTDIEWLCEDEPDQKNCISTTMLSMGCCAASVLESTASPLKQDTPHEGLTVPAGSTISYNQDCSSSIVYSDEPMLYHEVLIRAADGHSVEMFTGGKPFFAVVAGNQTVHGLNLARGKAIARFHDNGLPARVSLKNESRQNDRWFKAMTQPKTVEVPGFPKRPRKDLTELHSNGQVARGNLSRPTKIDGIDFAPGVTTFYDTGKVTKGRLARSQRFGEIDLPASTILEMSASGQPTYFTLPFSPDYPHSTTYYNLDGLRLSGGSRIEVYPEFTIKRATVADYSLLQGKLYPPATQITFNTNGTVTSDSFYDNIEENLENNSNHRYPRVLLKSETFSSLKLPPGSLIYEDRTGRAVSAALPRPFEYAGYKFAPGKIEFHKDGSIRHGKLDHDQLYNDMYVSARESGISLYKNGKLKKATLADDYIIDGTAFRKGTKISLDIDGFIESGVLARPTTLFGFDLPKSTHVTLNEKALTYIRTAQPINLNGVDFDGRRIRIRSHGLVRSGILQNDTLFDKTMVPAGTRILLSPQGKIWRSEFVGKRFQQKGIIASAGPQLLDMMDPPSRESCIAMEKYRLTGGPIPHEFKTDCLRYGDLTDKLR